MRLLCPAKINLHLRVGRRRADGFHPLSTWMVTVGLFDTLTVETLPHAAQIAGEVVTSASPGRERAGAARILQLSSNLPGLPADGSNLVERAADAFADAIASDRGARDLASRAKAGPSVGAAQVGAKPGSDAFSRTTDKPTAGSGGPHPLAEGEGNVSPNKAVGAAPPLGFREGVGAGGAAGQRPTSIGGEAGRHVLPVRAVLEKQIPLGAGLGGGSSDAARTLMGLNRLWQIDWPAERLAEVAGRLGSDIPFFVYGPSSVCTGRGEVIRPIAAPTVAKWVVLVLPDIHMPTPAVYRRFDELNLGFDDEIEHEPDWNKWASLPSKELLPGLVNDLERPAFDIQPKLNELRTAIQSQLGQTVRMSGSGSSLFTLYDDAEAARRAAEGVSGKFAVRVAAVELAPVGAKDDLNASVSPA